MRIIPVIDLKDGQVVRGMAGARENYRPVESMIAVDARPTTVAKAFVRRGFADLYVADLDAIAGADPAWGVYEQMARCGARMTIDAGLGNATRAFEMATFHSGNAPLAGIVAGLESLCDTDALPAIVEVVGSERLIFSLDLKENRPLTKVDLWQDLDATDLADIAVDAGIRQMIVLDLHRVGVGQGVGTEPLCRLLADRYPTVEIIAGGGVRHLADLQSLAAAGCSAAMVASALHDGRIAASEIRAMQS